MSQLEFLNDLNSKQTDLKTQLEINLKHIEDMKNCEMKRKLFSIEGTGTEKCFGRAYNDDSCRNKFDEIPRTFQSNDLVCPDLKACESKGNYGTCEEYGYSPSNRTLGRRYDDNHTDQGSNTNTKGEKSYKCPRTISCDPEICEAKRELFSIEGSGTAGTEACFGRAYNDDGCRRTFPTDDKGNGVPRSISSSSLVCPDLKACEASGNYGTCTDYGFDPSDSKAGRRYDWKNKKLGENTNSKGQKSYKCPRTIRC